MALIQQIWIAKTQVIYYLPISTKNSQNWGHFWNMLSSNWHTLQKVHNTMKFNASISSLELMRIIYLPPSQIWQAAKNDDDHTKIRFVLMSSLYDEKWSWVHCPKKNHISLGWPGKLQLTLSWIIFTMVVITIFCPKIVLLLFFEIVKIAEFFSPSFFCRVLVSYSTMNLLLFYEFTDCILKQSATPTLLILFWS